MRTHIGFLLAALMLAAPLSAGAAPKKASQPFPKTISFQKHIGWIITHRCLACHSAEAKKGGLALDTYNHLLAGGKSGKVIVPCKPEASRLYQLLTGKAQPRMPLGEPLSARHIKMFAQWIKAGAKADIGPDVALGGKAEASTEIKVPKIKLQVPMLPEVSALAWSPDGKIVAAGLYREVKLFDPATGKLLATLGGHADKIHSLKFSPDGKILAAAGGLPAVGGEIKFWSIPDGKLLKTATGHKDYIFTFAWSPDGKQFATASYDKLVKIWDYATGKPIKDLKDHADSVYALAWSPDGNLLASGGADRAIKVWDPKAGKRLYTLNGHGDTVLALEFNKASNTLYSVGADKTFRTWTVNKSNGKQVRSVTAHGGVATSLDLAKNGNMLATVSEDRSMKLWNPANGGGIRTVGNLSDGLLSVAFSPDSQEVAVGGFDGALRIFKAADGSVVRELITPPEKPGAKKEGEPAAKPKAAAK